MECAEGEGIITEGEAVTEDLNEISITTTQNNPATVCSIQEPKIENTDLQALIQIPKSLPLHTQTPNEGKPLFGVNSDVTGGNKRKSKRSLVSGVGRNISNISNICNISNISNISQFSYESGKGKIKGRRERFPKPLSQHRPFSDPSTKPKTNIRVLPALPPSKTKGGDMSIPANNSSSIKKGNNTSNTNNTNNTNNTKLVVNANRVKKISHPEESKWGNKLQRESSQCRTESTKCPKKRKSSTHESQTHLTSINQYMPRTVNKEMMGVIEEEIINISTEGKVEEEGEELAATAGGLVVVIKDPPMLSLGQKTKSVQHDTNLMDGNYYSQSTSSRGQRNVAFNNLMTDHSVLRNPTSNIIPNTNTNTNTNINREPRKEILTQLQPPRTNKQKKIKLKGGKGQNERNKDKDRNIENVDIKNIGNVDIKNTGNVDIKNIDIESFNIAEEGIIRSKVGKRCKSRGRIERRASDIIPNSLSEKTPTPNNINIPPQKATVEEGSKNSKLEGIGESLCNIPKAPLSKATSIVDIIGEGEGHPSTQPLQFPNIPNIPNIHQQNTIPQQHNLKFDSPAVTLKHPQPSLLHPANLPALPSDTSYHSIDEIIPSESSICAGIHTPLIRQIFPALPHRPYLLDRGKHKKSQSFANLPVLHSWSSNSGMCVYIYIYIYIIDGNKSTPFGNTSRVSYWSHNSHRSHPSGSGKGSSYSSHSGATISSGSSGSRSRGLKKYSKHASEMGPVLKVYNIYIYIYIIGSTREYNKMETREFDWIWKERTSYAST